MKINRRKLVTGSAFAALGLTGFAKLSFGRDGKAASPLNSTPASDGFRMPGEFEPHEAIWLVWPEEPTWRLEGVLAEKVITKLATAIAGDIPLRLAASGSQMNRVRLMVPEAVEIVEIEAGTGWVRDDGPIFLSIRRQKRCSIMSKRSGTRPHWFWREAQFIQMAEGLSSQPKNASLIPIEIQT